MAFEGIMTESFLSTPEEWHYYAGGMATGMIFGILIGILFVIIIIWVTKKKDNPCPEKSKRKKSGGRKNVDKDSRGK